MKNDYLWSLTKKTNVCKITVAECICIYTLYATILERKKKEWIREYMCVCVYIYMQIQTQMIIQLCVYRFNHLLFYP